MLHTRTGAAEHRQPRLTVALARTEQEVREAQKLRWQVFAEELGARLPSTEPGVDIDLFDRHCDHLLVRDSASGEVVGTYRILTGESAKRIGGFYSDDEFDLTRLHHLRERSMEIGRSCVHPDHRNGGTIAMLWAGLAAYIQTHHYEYLIGCASVGMADGGHGAASIYNALRGSSMSPVEYRVFPRCPLPLDRLDITVDAPVPALIKGYVRCGAWVCGEPAWDPDFNTADLLMLMPLSRLDSRYARHFLKHVKID
ncbi:MAG: GNAT family N-acetyltransferase [Burkholderiales bacterium]|nr:GNAT family N-acetyltransferase [Burkholderiales bacterium]